MPAAYLTILLIWSRRKNDRKPAELSRAMQADRQARAVQGGRLSTEPGE
jgi:hypothetical protein